MKADKSKNVEAVEASLLRQRAIDDEIKRGRPPARLLVEESPITQRFYTVQEVADLLQFSVDTIQKHFRDLPGVVALQGPRKASLRISAAALEKWIADRSAGFTVKARKRGAAPR
jgi:hypothetical protein